MIIKLNLLLICVCFLSKIDGQILQNNSFKENGSQDIPVPLATQWVFSWLVGNGINDSFAPDAANSLQEISSYVSKHGQTSNSFRSTNSSVITSNKNLLKSSRE